MLYKELPSGYKKSEFGTHHSHVSLSLTPFFVFEFLIRGDSTFCSQSEFMLNRFHPRAQSPPQENELKMSRALEVRTGLEPLPLLCGSGTTTGSKRVCPCGSRSGPETWRASKWWPRGETPPARTKSRCPWRESLRRCWVCSTRSR